MFPGEGERGDFTAASAVLADKLLQVPNRKLGICQCRALWSLAALKVYYLDLQIRLVASKQQTALGSLLECLRQGPVLIFRSKPAISVGLEFLPKTTLVQINLCLSHCFPGSCCFAIIPPLTDAISFFVKVWANHSDYPNQSGILQCLGQ